MNFNELTKAFKEVFADRTPVDYDGNFYLQFELTDMEGKAITVVIYPGIVEIEPHKYLRKDLLVKCTSEQALEIANKKVRFADLPSKGIDIEGDLEKADELFNSFTSRKVLLGL